MSTLNAVHGQYQMKTSLFYATYQSEFSGRGFVFSFTPSAPNMLSLLLLLSSEFLHGSNYLWLNGKAICTTFFFVKTIVKWGRLGHSHISLVH